MVWELAPLNSSSGASKYFFTSHGTYKVGRKDCAVTIQTDKTISRVHADIIIEEAVSWDFLQSFSNIQCPRISLKDVSKFGTFVNKKTDSKPVFALANKQMILNDGDLITFGTNNTTFRLNFVPLLFCIPSLENLKLKHGIHNIVSSLGAYATDKWLPECTHLVVEDSSPVTNNVIDAVVAKKPIVLCDWLQAMAGQTSSLAEIPNCFSFAPTLTLKQEQLSIPVKMADPKVRETSLIGFTFVVGSLHLYHYKERLQLLLEVAGATVVPVAQRCSNIQSLADAVKHRKVLIIPAEGTKKQVGLESDKFRHINEISRMSEDTVVVAVLSGEFNACAIEAPSSPISSSSTEGALDVADSEDHMDITSANQHAEGQRSIDCRGTSWTGNGQKNSAVAREVQNHSEMDGMNRMTSVREVRSAGLTSARRAIEDSSLSQTKLQFKADTREKECYSIGSQSLGMHGYKATEHANMLAVKVDTESKIEEKDTEGSNSTGFLKSDILYNPDLIVRKDWDHREIRSSSKRTVPNFKCFRKKTTISGNSFNDLIPFAKDPYKESDYGREMSEYIKGEKKRKEAEALAEDLFNAERIKRRRGTAGASLLEAQSQSFPRQKIR